MTNKLIKVQERVHASAIKHAKDVQKISILAVSKKKSLQNIHDIYQNGQRDFGENYLQEALDKIEANTYDDIVWHFIGPIQSNKTKSIAENFDWVHSVDRLKVAERLSKQRPCEKPPLNICIQVNIDKEENKSGIPPEDAESLALEISKFDNIRLRGLMAIPRKGQSDENSPFKRMQYLFNTLKKHPNLAAMDTLSMGMSADMEDAIQYGATIVRIGTALFGERN